MCDARPGCPGGLGLRTPRACGGSRPAACCQAGPSFPAVACASPRPPPPGLSTRGLLLTDRVCAAGAVLCGRVLPPTRVTVFWVGGLGRGARGTLLRAELSRSAHTLPGDRPERVPPKVAQPHTRLLFKGRVYPSLSWERRRRGGLWAGPGARKGEEVPRGPRAPLSSS